MKHMDTWHIFWHAPAGSTPKVRSRGFEAPPLHMEALKFLSPLIDITLHRLNSEKSGGKHFPPAGAAGFGHATFLRFFSSSFVSL